VGRGRTPFLDPPTSDNYNKRDSDQRRILFYCLLAMKSQVQYVLLLGALLIPEPGSAEEGGPIQKVIELLGQMQAKAIKEGEAEQGQFEKFSRWCERSSIEKQNTIADEQEQIVGLQATIDTASANIEQLKAVVEKVSADVSANEAELKDAVKIREKSTRTFW
jgi:hypothetical protein